MLPSLVLAVATFAGPPAPVVTPPPYLPIPCKIIVAQAHLEGKTITRHNLAIMFETALSMHGGAEVKLEDIGRALVDMSSARSCLAIPQATALPSGPPSIPPRRR